MVTFLIKYLSSKVDINQMATADVAFPNCAHKFDLTKLKIVAEKFIGAIFLLAGCGICQQVDKPG